MKIFSNSELGIMLFLLLFTTLRAEEKTDDKDVRIFVGKVSKIEMSRRGATGGIQVDFDARWFVTIVVLKSETEPEKVETRVYYVHSPTVLFGRFPVIPTSNDLSFSGVTGHVFSFKDCSVAKTNSRRLEVLELKK